MRLKLTLDLCKKLLEVMPHERTTCSDRSNFNQVANSAGWVRCSRCWLLQVVQDGCVPDDAEFDLFSSVKIKTPPSAGELLEQLMGLMEKWSADSPKVNAFIEANRGNSDFLQLAISAQNVKRKIDEGRIDELS